VVWRENERKRALKEERECLERDYFANVTGVEGGIDGAGELVANGHR